MVKIYHILYSRLKEVHQLIFAEFDLHCNRELNVHFNIFGKKW